MGSNYNYVQFIRGTPKAWANLKEKSDDVLYFICEKGASRGSLYLGSTLISGLDSISIDEDLSNRVTNIEHQLENFTDKDTDHLSQLQDVELKIEISDGSVLTYDKESGKWTNTILTIPEAAEVMKGASDCEDGTSGLVPKPYAGQENLYLQANGEWSDPTGEWAIKFAILYGKDKENLSIREIAADEISKIVGKNVPEDYNTIEKNANWIVKNGTALDSEAGSARLNALEIATFGDDKTSQTNGLVKQVSRLEELMNGYSNDKESFEGLIPMTQNLQFEVIAIESKVDKLTKNYNTINNTVTDLSSRLQWRKY